MTYETLTAVFGWMTLVSFGLLALTTGAMMVMRDWATGIHARMFDMDAGDVRKAWYGFLAQWKVLTIVFALAPYLALRLAA